MLSHITRRDEAIKQQVDELLIGGEIMSADTTDDGQLYLNVS